MNIYQRLVVIIIFIKFLTVEISKILETILETPIPFFGQALTVPEIN